MHLESLSSEQKHSLLTEIERYTPFLKEQQTTLKEPPASFNLKPLSSYDTSGNLKNITTGKKLLSQGKMGCLILAGGQGTRLSSTKSKALLPVTLIKHKTLLQFFCEKTLAASQESKNPLPLAIMTSPLNHEEIATYLQENQFFGLKDSQVSLFSQESLPFLDDQGSLLLERPGKLATGPDGNGHSLKLFVSSGISKKWEAQGIQYVNMIPIDNPLADPFDAELLGTLASSKADICIKAMQRTSPQEQVGVLGLFQNKVCIQEYSELPQDSSSFMIGNTGLFCFTLPFIEKTAHLSLPLHLAHKKASIFSNNRQETALIWKFERFIFDLFPYADKIHVLVYPRKEIYAPIKNASGDKSLATTQQALLALDRRTYEKISGLPAPQEPFELSPSFYYPTPELLQKWKGKHLPLE